MTTAIENPKDLPAPVGAGRLWKSLKHDDVKSIITPLLPNKRKNIPHLIEFKDGYKAVFQWHWNTWIPAQGKFMGAINANDRSSRAKLFGGTDGVVLTMIPLEKHLTSVDPEEMFLKGMDELKTASEIWPITAYKLSFEKISVAEALEKLSMASDGTWWTQMMSHSRTGRVGERFRNRPPEEQTKWNLLTDFAEEAKRNNPFRRPGNIYNFYQLITNKGKT